MLKNPVFEPIELSHAERVESIRKACGNTLYVYTFASLFSWQAEEQYSICFYSDAFLLKNEVQGKNAYLFPCGGKDGKKAFIDYLIAHEEPVFYSLTDDDKLFLESEYPGQFSFSECRDEFVYLYDRAAQISLKGNAFKRQRHRINAGRSNAEEWSSEPLTEENFERALAINKKWSEINNTGLADTGAARLALENFSALSMWGLLFKADGEDAAYVAGSFVTPEIFDLCFCKILPKDCDFFIRWSTYCALPNEVKTIDCEDDLGIEGLRMNKLSRHPKELVRIWKGSYNR